MPSPDSERPETQKHKGSQQLPITELNRTVHEGPQVDTPARVCVSSDLERSDQWPLSQNTPRPSDAAENNLQRQSTPENVEKIRPPRKLVKAPKKSRKGSKTGYRTKDSPSFSHQTHPTSQNTCIPSWTSTTSRKDIMQMISIWHEQQLVNTVASKYVYPIIFHVRRQTDPQCNQCQKARKVAFCILDSKNPARKCLRYIRNRVRQCTVKKKMLKDCEEDVTKFSSMKKPAIH